MKIIKWPQLRFRSEKESYTTKNRFENSKESKIGFKKSFVPLGFLQNLEIKEMLQYYKNNFIRTFGLKV